MLGRCYLEAWQAVAKPGCFDVACRHFRELKMAWTTPVVVELCLGMEVTSYESASL